VREDFPEPRAFLQARAFVTYFARNFRFGHELFRLAQGARDWAELVERVGAFLAGRPERLREPDVSGLA
jgi:DNA-binding IclR family transcriptional regulator